MKFIAIIGLALSFLLVPGERTMLHWQDTEPPINLSKLPTHPFARPVPAIERALIISIDGLRPDVLLRADAPNIRRLYQSGSFTFWARTTALAVTLPSHVSMLTGATPEQHGITWNGVLSPNHPIYPAVPTLFEYAHHAGYSTAMVIGKTKFVSLTKPGTLDWVYLPPIAYVTDAVVADEAVKFIRAHQPQVLFVHFPGVDVAGHGRGWGTPAQVLAAAEADRAVGLVLAALDKMHLRDSTFILVTADHGGQNRGHGPNDPRSQFIPWIACGPGISSNLDLTRYPKLTVDTEDTFATVCWLLGIPTAPRRLHGKPITEMIQRTELLQTVAP